MVADQCGGQPDNVFGLGCQVVIRQYLLQPQAKQCAANTQPT